jgi:hypothetical protein
MFDLSFYFYNKGKRFPVGQSAVEFDNASWRSHDVDPAAIVCRGANSLVFGPPTPSRQPSSTFDLIIVQ